MMLGEKSLTGVTLELLANSDIVIPAKYTNRLTKQRLKVRLDAERAQGSRKLPIAISYPVIHSHVCVCVRLPSA